eukprot:295408-Chlamydomonas_euryale.AAC.2
MPASCGASQDANAVLPTAPISNASCNYGEPIPTSSAVCAGGFTCVDSFKCSCQPVLRTSTPSGVRADAFTLVDYTVDLRRASVSLCACVSSVCCRWPALA